MQAIIMAAGKGSRIEELTNGHPKSFLEIKGKKLIERNIEMLQELGIKDIIVVTGYHTEEFESLFSNNNNIRFVYNPFYEMTNVLGSFFMGMQYLHDDFVYLHADTICEKSLLNELLSAKGDVVLPVDMKICDEEAMKVKMRGDKIERITKQMPPKESVGEFIGIANFKKKTLSALQRATKQLMIEKAFSEYFEAAIQRMIDSENFDIRVLDITGRFWAEIDFKDDYERAVAEELS